MLKDKKKIINETERDFSIWSYSVCKSLMLEGPLRSIFGGSPEWVKWHIAIPLRLSSYVVRVQLSVIRLDTILHVYFFLKTTLPLLPFLFWFEASQGYEEKMWNEVTSMKLYGRGEICKKAKFSTAKYLYSSTFGIKWNVWWWFLWSPL